MAHKKTGRTSTLSSPKAAEAINRQQELWEKYHGSQSSSSESVNKPARVLKIYAKEKPTNGKVAKSLPSRVIDPRIEANQPELEERTKAMDATKGTHIYRDQKWFGRLASFDNYGDEAFS